MGFSITCPALVQLERTYSSADFNRSLRSRAREIALDHVDDLHAGAKEAGASQGLLSDIGVFDEPDGSLLLGVPPGGPASQEAFDLEYGTPVAAPHGWARAHWAAHKRTIEHALAEAVIDFVKYGPK